MARKHLHELAKALRQPMPEGFTFDFPIFFNLEEDGTSCGCALGLSTILFKADGFVMDQDNELPAFGWQRAYAAASEFFEISYDQAWNFFHTLSYGAPGNQVTPQQVATRISLWLANNGLVNNRLTTEG